MLPRETAGAPLQPEPPNVRDDVRRFAFYL
jgi:hypothetical protein